MRLNRELIQHLANVFEISPEDIKDIVPMDVGMTNSSFVFTVKDVRYVVRVPGDGTENFISRKNEAEVYQAIETLKIADEVFDFDPETGIKITYYYPNSRNVANDEWPLIRQAMQIMRKLHQAELVVDHYFDIEKKLQQFEAMCRKVDCLDQRDYQKALTMLDVPLEMIRTTDAPYILCHGDAANVNFLVLEDQSLKLLDWEYSGMCHGVADVAMFGVFSDYSEKQFLDLLKWYFGREPKIDEIQLYYSYIAVSGILWSMWAEYRQYHGEDFGNYAQINYEMGINYSKLVADYK
ncbi:phosphotransferase family protein [Enterococcus sp. 669A]|uniref:Phosphotransferase family protein n=1 Tax=Candidatus Enterococcus moelleringii TaxID=2815325 RepID=A0ABS3LA83_9ENTE|nr:choline/ethanolamine kinase family protein [Enterococcus sp. 669A]MBO1305943.1 phosphotransferase family protein [Enterococcus sp. 669A]